MGDTVERICPACRAAQHMSAHYCATCGAPLTRMLPARTNQWMPAVLRQKMQHPLVRGVAMGMAAVAVEVVVHVIQRALSRSVAQRIGTGDTPTALQRSRTTQRTTIRSRRRAWIWRDTKGNTRAEELSEWQRIDE